MRPSRPLREGEVIRRKSKTIKFGTIHIPYQHYRTGGRSYYMLFYHQAGRRRQECRSTFAALKRRAEQIATNISNGQAAMNAFTEADRARWLVVCQNFDRAGIAPELGSALLADAFATLSTLNPQPSTLLDACRDYADRRRIRLKPRTVSELATDLLNDRRQDGAGERWLGSLEKQLTRFAAWWTGPLDQLRAPDLNTWLRGLKSAAGTGAGPRTRANYRAAIIQLVQFAKANGALARDWSELDAVKAPKLNPGAIRILDPDQLVRLLAKAPDSLVPFIACAAFAGIRHEELAPPGDGPRLDWRNVNLDRRNIYIPAEVGKEGDRNVPISDNLAAWLADYRKSSGPICRLANASSALTRAKLRAGIPNGKNATRNSLRKSFITYRLALVKHIGQVAEEAGNSPSMIKSNYKAALEMPEDSARRWFSLIPQTADVLPLFAWAKAS